MKNRKPRRSRRDWVFYTTLALSLLLAALLSELLLRFYGDLVSY
jgi:hypothetical protein